jgi:DNA (cytosine-5)-methyltransferase 1
MVQVSYNKLWKKLIDLSINKTQLREITGISTGSLAKLSKCKPVGLEVIAKICYHLECDIGDIVEFIYEKK